MSSRRLALGQRMVAALQESGPAAAAPWLQAWLDTWPLDALLDEARASWEVHRDGQALAVLARHAEIDALLGLPSGSVPLPDDLPPHRVLTADALVSERTEVCRALVRGEIVAAVLTEERPEDPAWQLAVGELLLEGGATQESVLRYGPAGLLAPGAPSFAEVPTRAPAGLPGERLRQVAQAVVLPGTVKSLSEGRVMPTGWLVWSGPYKPVAVQPVAVELLRTLGEGTAAACDALGLELSQLGAIVDELVGIGALTAAEG